MNSNHEQEMPADKLRDFLMRPEATGMSGATGMQRGNNYASNRFDGAGGGGYAMAQMQKARKTETTAQVSRLLDEQSLKNRTRGSGAWGSGGTNYGALPRYRWQWAVQSITSGKYFLRLILYQKWGEVSVGVGVGVVVDGHASSIP